MQRHDAMWTDRCWQQTEDEAVVIAVQALPDTVKIERGARSKDDKELIT